MSSVKPWVEKYRPAKSSEVIGNPTAVEKLQSYISSYSKQKKKAALVHGPAGCGKTSIVHAIAHDFDYEILEVNASDFRNKDKINSIIGSAIQQRSLFGKSKIVLVDEADGIAGREDSGGVQALLAIIKKSAYPVILTANDAYDKKLQAVRKSAETIKFSALNVRSMAKLLKSISEKEDAKMPEDIIQAIARRSGGDMRAAINDLEALAHDHGKEGIDSVSEREKEDDIISSLMRVLKTTKAEIALGAFDNVKEDMDQVFLWVDENLPKEYEKKEDVARAYEIISYADVLKGRIRRWQHWRFMAYIYELLTAGVAVAKDEKYKKFVPYSPASRILTLWITKQKRDTLKAIALKVGNKTHCSAAKAMSETIPYVRVMLKNKNEAEKLSKYFNLTEDEVKALVGGQHA